MQEHKYRVLKHVSLALGRRLETSVHEALGKKVRVAYEYTPDLKKAPGAITVLHAGLTRRGGNAAREYERTKKGEEQFRNPPVLLRGRFIVSCWAPPLDDQELLGVVIRTFHDHPQVEPQGEEEHTVSYDGGKPDIELETLSLEEHKKLCEAFGMPLAPSVAYWVDLVVQSAVTTPIKRVKERVIDVHKIE
jgi:hypothetical protein